MFVVKFLHQYKAKIFYHQPHKHSRKIFFMFVVVCDVRG